MYELDPREAFLCHMYSGDEDNGDEITSGIFPEDEEDDDDANGDEDDEEGEAWDCLIRERGAKR